MEVAAAPPDPVTTVAGAVELSVALAVYPLIAAPPFADGAEKFTVTCPSAATAVEIVGALGVVEGVTELVADDEAPAPFALLATTVNVYAVPFVSPLTVMGLALPVAIWPPEEVTVYPVMVEPPLDAGAEKLTLAEAFPAVALPMVGAPGTVDGVMEFDALEAALVPTPFVAVTVNVYAVPFAKPETLMGLVVPVPVTPVGDEVAV